MLNSQEVKIILFVLVLLAVGTIVQNCRTIIPPGKDRKVKTKKVSMAGSCPQQLPAFRPSHESAGAFHGV